MLTFFVSVPNERRSGLVAVDRGRGGGFVGMAYAEMLISTLLSTFASATLMRNNSNSRLVSAPASSIINPPRPSRSDAKPDVLLSLAGPPLHDALTIIYLTHPHLISGPTGRLHVDISKTERDGETTFTPVDGSDEQDARNRSKVLMDLDVQGFFEVMLSVVDEADKVVAKVEM